MRIVRHQRCHRGTGEEGNRDAVDRSPFKLLKDRLNEVLVPGHRRRAGIDNL